MCHYITLHGYLKIANDISNRTGKDRIDPRWKTCIGLNHPVDNINNNVNNITPCTCEHSVIRQDNCSTPTSPHPILCQLPISYTFDLFSLHFVTLIPALFISFLGLLQIQHRRPMVSSGVARIPEYGSTSTFFDDQKNTFFQTPLFSTSFVHSRTTYPHAPHPTTPRIGTNPTTGPILNREGRPRWLRQRWLHSISLLCCIKLRQSSDDA